SKIAFVGSMRQFENATHTEIYVHDIAQQSRICLTESLDIPVGDYVVADHQQSASAPGVVWTKDGHLYFQGSTMGDVRLYFASLDGAIYPASPDMEHVYGYDIARSGEFALAAISNPVDPGELYHLTIATGERKALTSFNKTFLDETELTAPQLVTAKGAKDWAVHGWLLKPYGFEEGKK